MVTNLEHGQYRVSEEETTGWHVQQGHQSDGRKVVSPPQTVRRADEARQPLPGDQAPSGRSSESQALSAVFL
ncbi:hypothetical protein AVEN_207127-1 [Araneus ventricosus]|uniref:Uncharacterized protein n=1 Tax=Araneus ventricosus TaxID=182803 RepID=A0A4Y2X2W7_ARAVE|nr:hypothetical protein AVEN_207127-1 [Araneus ventricosus]